MQHLRGRESEEERLRANLSQEQLAYKLQIIGLDVTQKVISRIENGSRVVADYELDYLATALAPPSTPARERMRKPHGSDAVAAFFVENRRKC